jgi:hypothetical protein
VITPSNVRPALAPEHAKRPPAPDHVWDYQSVASWRGTAWRLAGDFLDEAVKADFLKNPPKYVVCDDLGWSDDIITRISGYLMDTKTEMSVLLREQFTHIRAYHATSAQNVDAFYSKGLLPLDADAANNRARQIFLGGAFPELNEENLQRAIAGIRRDLREGRVYFEANERSLVGDCGTTCFTAGST